MTPEPSIAHYRIISKLGEGGMGAVYRATDTRLNRDVALKVLPTALAGDPDRMARFQREAQVLASLNHPNIAAIYGIEQGALVMELVEGAELCGPVPVSTALDYARQIAAGLEAAHEKGIVHRDLKPANIKVTADGVVKLLDFGLAKVAEASAAAASAGAEISRTLSLERTQAGAILGTAAYMAPEQARGKPVDKRADIWAFGVVLHGLLTGKSLFASDESMADTIAAVVTREPDWSALPAGTPSGVRWLLERCLRKDPKVRLRDIGDARLLLEGGDAPAARAPEIARPARLPWVVSVIACVAVLLLGAALWRATRPAGKPLLRFVADMGPEAVPGERVSAIISPDGTRLAFLVRSGDGSQMALATRLMDQSKATVLAGTESLQDPFFSPDGQWIGYAARGQLKKVSVQGGAPTTICPLSNDRGMDWGADGNIVIGLPTGGMLTVPASGGKPRTLSQPRSGEVTQRWPQILPGGKSILYTGHTSVAGFDEANIEVLSLETGATQIVQRGGYFGRYLPSGHLVYVNRGTLYAVPFDLKRNQVRGTPTPVLGDIAGNVATGAGQFSFSHTGTLVYRNGKPSEGTRGFIWLDSSGKNEPLPSGAEGWAPRFSPDGRQLAFASNGDVAIYDLARGNLTRIAHDDKALVSRVVWTPDGRHVAYRADRETGIRWVRSDGSESPQQLYQPPNGAEAEPGSFTPDGRGLAIQQSDAGGRMEIWLLPLDLGDSDHPKAGPPKLILRNSNSNADPRLSPDGRWMAYVSNDAGDTQVFVRPFAEAPGGGEQVHISTASGGEPHWSRSTNELFYLADDGHIMAVPYTIVAGRFEAGKPRRWTDVLLARTSPAAFDVMPDGKRLVAARATDAASAGEKVNLHLVFLLNFFDHLQEP